MRIEALAKLLEFDDVGVELGDTFVQLSVPPRRRELAKKVVVEAESQGAGTHQIANDYGNVTLTIAFDPRVLD